MYYAADQLMRYEHAKLETLFALFIENTPSFIVRLHEFEFYLTMEHLHVKTYLSHFDIERVFFKLWILGASRLDKP